jgi:hypothetical protein
MKTQAAISWDRGGPWSVEEIELGPPRRGESSSKWRLCHSGEHVSTGDLPWRFRWLESMRSGTVVDVGAGIEGLARGDLRHLGLYPRNLHCAPEDTVSLSALDSGLGREARPGVAFRHCQPKMAHSPTAQPLPQHLKLDEFPAGTQTRRGQRRIPEHARRPKSSRCD